MKLTYEYDEYYVTQIRKQIQNYDLMRKAENEPRKYENTSHKSQFMEASFLCWENQIRWKETPSATICIYI